jgi:capsular polysaccharide biosynthesis protein
VLYAPIVVTCAVLISVMTDVVLVLSSRNDDRAEVRALVVARRLVVTVEELDASVSAIFRFGGVAEAAVAEYTLDVNPDALKGELVDVVVVARTPVIQVVGRDTDPTRAAERANAVADVLVTALNDAGGIGTFAVVEQADPARADGPATVPGRLFSVVAGLLSAVAIYTALILWRRPMFTVEELAEVSVSPIVMRIERSPGNVERLADALARRHSAWLMVDLNSHRSHRLLARIRDVRPDLEIGATHVDNVARERRDRPDSLVVVVAATGVAQVEVRRAETVVGEQLAATVMVD